MASVNGEGSWRAWLHCLCPKGKAASIYWVTSKCWIFHRQYFTQQPQNLVLSHFIVGETVWKKLKIFPKVTGLKKTQIKSVFDWPQPMFPTLPSSLTSHPSAKAWFLHSQTKWSHQFKFLFKCHQNAENKWKLLLGVWEGSGNKVPCHKQMLLRSLVFYLY